MHYFKSVIPILFGFESVAVLSSETLSPSSLTYEYCTETGLFLLAEVLAFLVAPKLGDLDLSFLTP